MLLKKCVVRIEMWMVIVVVGWLWQGFEVKLIVDYFDCYVKVGCVFGLLLVILIEVEDKCGGGMVVEVLLFECVIFDGVVLVILDECGQMFSLLEFVDRIVGFCDQVCDIVFVIGGVDGIDFVLCVCVDLVISFGCMVWLYMLVWVMLVE